MVAIITGDIVNSGGTKPPVYLKILKEFLTGQGKSPKVWEIYRGDSFQFRCKPQDAFYNYLLLKSMVKQVQELDVRISIGIGNVEHEAARISQSNGTAFIRSGRTFDGMKEKQFLLFTTGDETLNRTLNLYAGFISLVADNWTAAAAQTVQIMLEHPKWSQQEVADKLRINQSGVSQNRKRSQLDLLLDFNGYFQTLVTSLKQ